MENPNAYRNISQRLDMDSLRKVSSQADSVVRWSTQRPGKTIAIQVGEGGA